MSEATIRENRAFEKFLDEAYPKVCRCPHCTKAFIEPMRAAWRACEEQMRPEIEELYEKAASLERRLEDSRALLYALNSSQSKPPPLTRADVEAWPIKKQRERVAVDVCGFESGVVSRRWYYGDVVNRLIPRASMAKDDFRPDSNPAHNWMVFEAMREKGFGLYVDYYGDGSCQARFGSYQKAADDNSPVERPGDELKAAIMLAALLAVLGL